MSISKLEKDRMKNIDHVINRALSKNENPPILDRIDVVSNTTPAYYVAVLNLPYPMAMSLNELDLIRLSLKAIGITNNNNHFIHR